MHLDEMILHKLVIIAVLCLPVAKQMAKAQTTEPSAYPDSLEITTEDTSAFYAGQEEGQDLWVGPGFGSGLLRNHSLLGFQEFSATVGAFIDYSHGLQINGSYMHTPIAHTSDPEYPVADGVSIVEFQADIRFYTPARYDFLDHYFSAGAGVMLAFWEYDPQLNFAKRKRNSSDFLVGYDVHVGMGFAIGQFWPLSVTLELTPGIVVWSKGTDEEYSRASLPTFLYCKVRAQINFLIRGS